LLTPTTLKTYNKLFSEYKPLIEIFFDIGIFLAQKQPKEHYINTLILSLADYESINEANMQIKQIQDFYNSAIAIFEALKDESNGFACDEAIDTMLTLEDFETTRSALHSASENMLEVLIEEFDLHEAIEPVSYVEMVENVEKRFGDDLFYAKEFLSLVEINTMLRKSKGADEEDCEEFTYKMYAMCQYFNDYRKVSV